MNKRLVWNFEINLNNNRELDNLISQEKESIRWEARFFWPENSIITLYNLDLELLNLAHFKIKERSDEYYLIPEQSLNIKKRRNEFIYKPLLKEEKGIAGFGEKINIMTTSHEQILPGTPSLKAETMIQFLQHSQAISVKKTVFIYKFKCSPTIKLELSRLWVNQNIYYSASVEGRSYPLVSQISHALLPKADFCDYVTFLKKQRP